MLLLFGAAYSLSLVVTDGNVVAAAILMFSFFLTYASVIPGQYYNQYRIRDEYVGKNDDKVLDECIRITTYFVVVSSVLILYLVLSGIAFHAPAIYIVACFVQFYLLAYLAFNLLILLIDVQVASLAVDGLFIRCKDKTLDLGTLVLVRENIHGRVSRSKWVTGVVLFPCVGAILSIILIIFALGKNNYGTYNIVFGIANMFVFVKEVLFVAIAFWHVARVNGKADELTVALSKSLWCPGPNCVPDVGRLSVYASSLSEPISYKLLFRRISWSDVAVNALSVSVTLIVGVVKYLVGLN